MTNDNSQSKQNDDLICRQRKWKKIERITLSIDLVLLFGFFVLSTVHQITNFNSIAFFVLAVIFSAIMFADLVILFISWYKLYRVNSLIAEQEKNSVDNDNDI